METRPNHKCAFYGDQNCVRASAGAAAHASPATGMQQKWPRCDHHETEESPEANRWGR